MKGLLISGGCGSIGNIILKSLLKYNAYDSVFVLDSSEYNTYKTKFNYRSVYGSEISYILSDINDYENFYKKISKCSIIDVIHAAAYKHVDLGEINPLAYMENNVCKTIDFVEKLSTLQIDKFYFISTDKAVEPVNVMGFSKFLCEFYFACLVHARKNSFKTIIVRLPNVYCSSGNVLETFTQTIKMGGEIVVRGRDTSRLFIQTEQIIQFFYELLKMETIKIGQFSVVSPLDFIELCIYDIAMQIVVGDNKSTLENCIKVVELPIYEKKNEKLLYDKEVLSSSVCGSVRISVPGLIPVKNFNVILGRVMREVKLISNKNDLISIIKNTTSELMAGSTLYDYDK